MDRRCTQPDWDAAIEQSSVLFLWLLSDKRGAEISQKLHQIVELISRIEGPLQSWSSIPLQVVCLRGNLPNICCLLKQRLNHRQASRHCQEILSKCSWHEPRAARLTHTPSLFCFCGLVTSKMSHGGNESCITQHVVAQGGATRLRSFEIHKTQLDVAGKSSAFFFFFLNQPLHASCGRPGPGGCSECRV